MANDYRQRGDYVGLSFIFCKNEKREERWGWRRKKVLDGGINADRKIN